MKIIRAILLHTLIFTSFTCISSDHEKQHGLAYPTALMLVQQRQTEIQQAQTRTQELPQIEAQYVQVQATELTQPEFPQFRTQAELEDFLSNRIDSRTKNIQFIQQPNGTQTIIINQRQDNCCEIAINSLQSIVCFPITIAAGACVGASACAGVVCMGATGIGIAVCGCGALYCGICCDDED